MDARLERRQIRVHGVVQGVGFRPFVYRLALEEHLAGFIGNDTSGVTIEVEGAPHLVDAFLRRLRTEAPALARIDALLVSDLEPKDELEFVIVASAVRGQVATGIPPDAATCADCLRELFDPSDRRYRYPFLNCTNCGPRFTITRRIPYDRPQTSMASFTMCSACQTEYDDPASRRFHAQPNACWDCGPRVWLTDAAGKRIEEMGPVTACIHRLHGGEIVAIKGVGGFHLCVDAANEDAVLRLRQRKHRYGKPLAVMVPDLDAARSICRFTAEEEKLLVTAARPIVLARSRADSGIAPQVAPGIPWLGVFLPYSPLQHLLFADARVRALVMTSANLSEEPIAIDNHEALERLGDIADAFLMHDREILQRCDDSVTAVVNGAPQLIRRARGFVPLGVRLSVDAPALLAVGGHLKSVFTLARGEFAYQSQHIGDLENLTGLNFFRESLAHLMRTFEIEPEAVAHDLHPEYLSTKFAREWAQEQDVPAIAVQHHHAHVAGCMAEHELTGPAIGLSLDGTGYGTDGKIWGGEVLICRLEEFERFAHLDYVPMAGGEKAIREPWRMAFGALHAADLDVESPEVLTLLGAKLQEAQLLKRMIAHGVNSPLTSSLGRLFDAVAAVVLQRHAVAYEAQAAMELEGVAIDEPDQPGSGYPFAYIEGNWRARQPAKISAAPMWRELLLDLKAGRGPAAISARFHAGVAMSFVQAAQKAGQATGIQQVVLSGGCVHNRRLARLLRSQLEREGFAVYEHAQVSPGDGGLSYGQAMVAAARLRLSFDH